MPPPAPTPPSRPPPPRHPPPPATLSQPADRFEAQLQWLRDNHVEIIGAGDLTRFLDGSLDLPERVAVITIDDGHRSVRRVAFPILRRYGAPFTLALNTAAIEGRRPEAVTWDEVREMMASGLCGLASHSRALDDARRIRTLLLRISGPGGLVSG